MGFSPTPVGLHLSVKVGGLTHYTLCELPTLFHLFFSVPLSSSLLSIFCFFLLGVIRHSSPFVSHDRRAEGCTYASVALTAATCGLEV